MRVDPPSPLPAPDRPAGGVLARRPLFVSLVLNAVLFAGVYLAFAPHFMTNDDTATMLLAAGVSTVPSPTANLTFATTSGVIGHVLQALYTIAPRWPWYALYLVAALWTAHVVLLFLLLRRRPSALSVALYLGFFGMCGVFLLLNLQFTVAAALCSAAGLLVLFWADPAAEASSPARRRRRAAGAAVAVGLIVLGSLIRWDAFRLALAVLAPAGVLYAVGARRGRLAPRVAAVLLAGAASWAMVQVDRATARPRQGWDAFRQFDTLRRRFVDDKVLAGYDEATLRSVVAKAGWSVNDYRMLAAWVWMDPRVYNVSSFRAVLAQVGSVNPVRWDLLKAPLRRMVFSVCGVGAALLVLLTLLLWPRRWRETAAPLGTALICAFWVVVLVYVRRFPPPRVYLPMFWMTGAVALLSPTALPAWRAAGRFRRLAVLAAAAMVAALLVAEARNSFATTREARAREARLVELVNGLRPDPNDLYVVWGGAFPWDWLSPFGELDAFRRFRTFNFWSDQNTPTIRAALRGFGIDDIYPALAQRDRVYLIRRGGDDVLSKLDTFMREHYGYGVTGTTVRVEAEFTVDRIRPAEDSRGTAAREDAVRSESRRGGVNK